MKTNKAEQKTHENLSEKAEDKTPLKNQNPNDAHNAKKVSLGPNTKR